MSSSDPTSAIFMSDTKKEVQKKINKYAFSGGGETAEEHREHGGNPDVDVPYQYLTYFLEDDVELKRIHDTYKSGEMLTGEIKQYCIRIMQEYVEGFQSRRAKVSDAVLQEYMTPRRLQWGGKPRGATSSTEPSQSQQASAPAPPPATAPTPQAPTQPAQAQAPQVQITQTMKPQDAAPNMVPNLNQDSVESKEKPQRPGLATLRGKSYGVRGLSQYATQMSSMIYGDDSDEDDDSDTRRG